MTDMTVLVISRLLFLLSGAIWAHGAYVWLYRTALPPAVAIPVAATWLLLDFATYRWLWRWVGRSYARRQYSVHPQEEAR